MEKKSKVVSAQANGTWEGKFGVMYKHEVAFENGDAGEYSSKSAEQTKFIVGTETEYEFLDGKFPKVKPVNNFQQGGGFTPAPKNDKVQEYIIKQSSLKAACDYCIANGGDETTIIDIAEIFTVWVLKGEKPTGKSTNDLPF